MGNKDCVLVVDDEFLIADVLTDMIEDMGLTVCATAATAEEAVILATQYRPGLVLMDMRLRGQKDGVDAVTAIHQAMIGSQVIFITGSREPETVRRIALVHPAAVLFKPIHVDQLQKAVRQALPDPDILGP